MFAKQKLLKETWLMKILDILKFPYSYACFFFPLKKSFKWTHPQTGIKDTIGKKFSGKELMH